MACRDSLRADVNEELGMKEGAALTNGMVKSPDARGQPVTND